LVEGRLQIRNYETQGGDKRWVTEVVAQNVVFLGSGSRDSQVSSFKGYQEPSSTIGSLRDEFPDEFPTDISEMEDGGEEADIPF
jgi:single-strand DNA-binding protein